MSGKRRRFDGFLKPRIGFVQPSDAALEMHKSIARAAKPFSELAEKLRPLTEAMRPMAEFSARQTDAINPVVGDEEAPEIKNNISERPKRNIATPTASPIAAAHLQRFLLDRADGETTEPNLKKAAQDCRVRRRESAARRVAQYTGTRRDNTPNTSAHNTPETSGGVFGVLLLLSRSGTLLSRHY